ncbi:23S rRNA (guanine745-N1)-methyltransferase [Nakamurella sp. UYEF19]
MVQGDGSFLCTNRHSFDVAKQGYVALLGAASRTDTADSPDMVSARVDFLGAGHYARIAGALAEAVVRAGASAATVAGPVLEIGAGTGYYLGAVLDGLGPGGSGIALDSSKYAARRAAADPRVVSAVADAWSPLPVRSGAVRAVLSVFAPRDPAQITRVLAPGGVLGVVTPEPSHLAELREQLGMLTVDDGKAERIAVAFAGLLDPTTRERVEFQMPMSHRDVSALVRMGPSARHLDPADLAGTIARLPESVTVTASVTVTVLAKTA